mgnify:CR=1 FL=1
MDRKYDVITLGEILLRLSTPINGRLAQGDTFMKHLGGAELNIASEIGQLGLNTAIISKIPTNLLAAFIKNQLNASRVSENYLIEDHSAESAFTTMNMVLIQENPVLSMTENTLPLII